MTSIASWQDSLLPSAGSNVPLTLQGRTSFQVLRPGLQDHLHNLSYKGADIQLKVFLGHEGHISATGWLLQAGADSSDKQSSENRQNFEKEVPPMSPVGQSMEVPDVDMLAGACSSWPISSLITSCSGTHRGPSIRKSRMDACPG